MALLNFSQTYANIQNKIGTPGYLQETDLLFTGDGHIVTHGVDYIPWGDGTIPIEKLPIAAVGDDPSDNTLWTSLTIQNKINNSFLANEAMRFKGSISIEDNAYKINGTRTPDGTLPKGEVGDTYRVSTNGRYGSNDCEVGDLLICYESGTTKETDGWTVVQTNINGYSTFRINGTPYYLYTTDSKNFEIYAPTEPGAANGQILLWDSDRNEAVWAGRDALNIGKSLTTGNGLWIGTGNTVDNTGYNGSADKTIKLLQATTDSIGGVIIDSNGLQLDGKPERVTGDGATLNGATISISDTGVIYLTTQNIINALGYTPEGMGAVSWRPIKVNDEDFLNSNAAGVPLNIGSENSTIVITPSTGNSGKVSFDVNLGYDTINDTSAGGLKRVAVKAGREGTNLGKLYVEIPEYAVVSNEINGLAPKIITDETDKIDPSYSILASKEGTSAGWYKLDLDKINTWRPISIATKDLENRSLKIVGTDNVVFTYDEQEFNQGKTATFGIELQWKEWTDNELI